MARQINITDARQGLLDLPDKLLPGESVEVLRRKRPVLRIIRTEEAGSPFSILDQALEGVRPSRRSPPVRLAANYKSHLYG